MQDYHTDDWDSIPVKSYGCLVFFNRDCHRKRKYNSTICSSNHCDQLTRCCCVSGPRPRLGSLVIYGFLWSSFKQVETWISCMQKEPGDSNENIWHTSPPHSLHTSLLLLLFLLFSTFFYTNLFPLLNLIFFCLHLTAFYLFLSLPLTKSLSFHFFPTLTLVFSLSLKFYHWTSRPPLPSFPCSTSSTLFFHSSPLSTWEPHDIISFFHHPLLL